MIPVSLEAMSGDLPDGGWRLVIGRAQSHMEPKSATKAKIDLYGEWAKIARTSPEFQQELKGLLIKQLLPKG